MSELDKMFSKDIIENRRLIYSILCILRSKGIIDEKEFDEILEKESEKK